MRYNCHPGRFSSTCSRSSMEQDTTLLSMVRIHVITFTSTVVMEFPPWLFPAQIEADCTCTERNATDLFYDVILNVTSSITSSWMWRHAWHHLWCNDIKLHHTSQDNVITCFLKTNHFFGCHSYANQCPKTDSVPIPNFPAKFGACFQTSMEMGDKVQDFTNCRKMPVCMLCSRVNWYSCQLNSWPWALSKQYWFEY